MKKRGLSLSIKQLVLITLSIIAIIAGVFLITNITNIKDTLNEIPSPFPSTNSQVSVYPESSQAGTQFLIRTTQPPKETQDLQLIIETTELVVPIILYDDGEHSDQKPKDGIYGGFFNSENKPLGLYQIKKDEETLATFTISEPGCEVIQGSIQDDSIDFAVLPSGYDTYEEFKTDAEEIISGKDSIFQIEPFKTNSKKFSTTLIKTSQDLECEPGCSSASTVVCCNNKKVQEEASLCQHDSVYVLVNSKKNCGSASSYTKVCAKQSVAKLALLHELGHSFAGLADEYVYKNYDIGEIDAPNCAKSPTCDKWSEQTSGCFQGCTYDSLYRPSEKSLMSDYVPYFNTVSENHIEKIIANHIQQASEIQQPAPKSYFINLEYNQGEITIKEKILKPIQAPTQVLTSPYTVKILNKNKILQEIPIQLPIEELSLPDNPDDPIQIDNFEYPIILPYYSNADKLEIYENQQIIAETSLTAFQQTCGNNICENSENALNCKSDCQIHEDNFCQNSECDPDCPSQPNCQPSPQQTEFTKTLGIILIILAVLTIILTLILRSKEHEQS